MAYYHNIPTAARLRAQMLPVQTMPGGGYGFRVVVVDPAAIDDPDRPYVLGDKWFQTDATGHGLYVTDNHDDLVVPVPLEELTRLESCDSLDLTCSAGTRRKRAAAVLARIL